MFPCGICLLIHLNTFGRLGLPKTVCNRYREGDLKGRKQWRITEAVKSWEAEILSSPKSEFFPAYMKDRWLESQVAANYKLLLSSALQKIHPFEYFPEVFHIHLPKEKTWNPLNFVCCCTAWRQAFHNTWMGTCTWGQIVLTAFTPGCSFHVLRMISRRGSCSWAHFPAPAFLLSLCSSPASASPPPASAPAESAAEQRSGVWNQTQLGVLPTHVTPLPVFSAPLSLG